MTDISTPGVQPEASTRRGPVAFDDGYAAIFDAIPALVFYKDRYNRFLRVNAALATAMRLTKDQIEGKTCSELWPNQSEDYWRDDREVVATGLPKKGIIEPMATPDGMKWYRTDKIPYLDAQGNILGVIGCSVDITDRIRAEEAVRTLSLTDDLTGLCNRRGFVTLAEQQLKIANRTKVSVHLLYADVDGLKAINDTMGHHVGDEVIRAAARLLRATFRDADILARMGGDEFVILMVDTDGHTPAEFVDRLRESLRLESARDGHGRLSMSVGVVPYDKQAPCSLEEWLRRADAAMYEDKRRHHGSHGPVN